MATDSSIKTLPDHLKEGLDIIVVSIVACNLLTDFRQLEK